MPRFDKLYKAATPAVSATEEQRLAFMAGADSRSLDTPAASPAGADTNGANPKTVRLSVDIDESDWLDLSAYCKRNRTSINKVMGGQVRKLLGRNG